MRAGRKLSQNCNLPVTHKTPRLCYNTREEVISGAGVIKPNIALMPPADVPLFSFALKQRRSEAVKVSLRSTRKEVHRAKVPGYRARVSRLL